MRLLLILSFLCLSISSCSTPTRSLPDLTEQEQLGLNYINKDPFMRIMRVDREDDEHVLVKTRQGNHIIMYRITAALGPDAKDMIELIPPHKTGPPKSGPQAAGRRQYD